MRTFKTALAASALILSVLTSHAARAADDFYRSHDVTLIVAAQAGGGYDTYARALAPYLQKHIPGNPNIIVQAMPGAGGLMMANHLFHQAKTDGSVIGLTLSTVVLNQLTRPKQVRYDARKFGWLGTMVSQTNALAVAAAATPVRSIADAKKTEVIIGATNVNSFLYQEPRLMNALLQTKFKLVTGYKGVPDLNLALERGEIGGHVSPWSTWRSKHGDWLNQGKVVPIIRTGAPVDDLPGVPNLIDLVEGEQAKSLVQLLDMSSIFGRSIATPPGTPPERIAILRKAVAAAVQDPAFVADMEKRKLPIGGRSGETLQAYVEKAVKISPETVDTFLKLMAAK